MSSVADEVSCYIYGSSPREGTDKMNERETSVSVKSLEGSPDVKVEEDFSHIPSKRTKIDGGEVGNASSSYDDNGFVVNPNEECVTEERTYRAKRSCQDTEKRQTKRKLFRDEWLTIDIFRDWLDRDPTNPRKARCVACNTTMNAGKSELEKHAAGARHERALDAMLQTITIHQLTAAAHSGNDGLGEVVPAEEDESLTGSSGSGNPESDTDVGLPVVIEQAVDPSEALEQHGVFELPDREVYNEALNRMAHALEDLSNNVNLLLERLTAQHECYLQLVKFVQERNKS